jgi:hypothetical protein
VRNRATYFKVVAHLLYIKYSKMLVYLVLTHICYLKFALPVAGNYRLLSNYAVVFVKPILLLLFLFCSHLLGLGRFSVLNP